MKKEIKGLMDLIIAGARGNEIDSENFFNVSDIEKKFTEIEELYQAELTQEDKARYIKARSVYCNQ